MTDAAIPDATAHPTAFRQYRQGLAAVALRLAGASFAEVAEALGIGNVVEARKMIESALANQVDIDGREHLRAEESARLDRLQRSVWTKATSADHPEHLQAVKVVLQISESRRRLLGLDAPAEITIHTPTQDEIERWVNAVAGASIEEFTIIEADVVGAAALPE